MNKDALIKQLIKYEMDVVDQENRIIQLRYLIDTESDAGAALAAREFAKANEEIYLRLKSLIYNIQGKPFENMAEEIGTTDSFPSCLNEMRNGVWRFTLPPFYSVSAKKKLYNEGKHMYYLVLNLLMDYEKKHGKIRKLEKPLFIFRHHICTDLQQPFDYDNIDSKRAIDAMQGYFVSDDNVLRLTVMHEAKEDPERSFCEIYAVDQAVIGSVYSPEFSRIMQDYIN